MHQLVELGVAGSNPVGHPQVMVESHTFQNESAADMEWMRNVLESSSRYILDEELILKRMTFAKRLHGWRMSLGYSAIQSFAQFLHEDLEEEMPLQTTRRLLRVWEYANNPHRQYHTPTMAESLEGIYSEEQLEKIQDRITQLIDDATEGR